MKKDIEWAKEEIKELMTEESQNYPHDEMVEKEIVLGILNQLDEPEKPVVPKFVANLIKVLKADEELTSVSDALYYGAKDDEEESVTDWRDENVDKFAKAWLDYPDIEIEEEPKYYVLDKEDRPLLLRFSQGIMRAPSGLSPLDEIVKNQRNSMQFTEQEIKDCDERLWAFAVPVEEVSND